MLNENLITAGLFLGVNWLYFEEKSGKLYISINIVFPYTIGCRIKSYPIFISSVNRIIA
ncbi:hypothetical protein K420107F6_14850 [Lactonifactor longoviformis]